MKLFTLQLPESLYSQLEEAARLEGISVNEFVTLAVAEKMATLETLDYLEERAKRGSREKMLAVLDKAPDVEPEPYDKL